MDGDVTLLDADISTHSIAREYGLDGMNGFSEVLNGSASLRSVAHAIPNTRLKIVTTGMEISAALRRVRTTRARELIDEIRTTSGYIIVDLPATLRSTAAPVVAGLCDGVILVVRSGHTTRQDVEDTLHLLKEANVLGVVLNRWESRIPRWVEKSLGLKR